MKPIERGEVLGLAEYDAIRDHFRARVIEEKKVRRIQLGDRASCVFENRDTVLLQIQEMLRTERMTREASIQHEIATYNELVPRARELSATILLEIDDKNAREEFLKKAKGLDQHFALVVGGVRCPGKSDPSREHEDRTTAVHYVKFALGEAAETALRKAKGGTKMPVVELVSTHPHYPATTRLPPRLVAALAEDLAEPG